MKTWIFFTDVLNFPRGAELAEQKVFTFALQSLQ